MVQWQPFQSRNSQDGPHVGKVGARWQSLLDTPAEWTDCRGAKQQGVVLGSSRCTGSTYVETPIEITHITWLNPNRLGLDAVRLPSSKPPASKHKAQRASPDFFIEVGPTGARNTVIRAVEYVLL